MHQNVLYTNAGSINGHTFRELNLVLASKAEHAHTLHSSKSSAECISDTVGSTAALSQVREQPLQKYSLHIVHKSKSTANLGICHQEMYKLPEEHIRDQYFKS